MANNVTVNITNNCGCCGSSSSGSGSILDGVMEGEILDPEIEGPPKGFIDPVNISDRQCKMSVWIYSWLEGIFDTLANSTTGDALLTLIATVPTGIVSTAILKFVTPVITGAITFVLAALGTPGVPDEAPLTVLATITTFGIMSIITNQTVVKNFTRPTAAKILEQLQLGKDELICALAKASDAYEAKAEYEKVLATFDLSITQRSIAIIFLNNQFLHMLFYSAEWWPSFDENILANISATCCGSIRHGDNITPGSSQSCQAASYIIDKLVETFNATNKYIEDFFYLNLNPFDNDTGYIIEQVRESLQIPSKIEEKAGSYNYYVSMVGAYINATTVTGGLIDHWFGTHFADLATELQTARSAIHAAILAASSPDAVYSAIYDPLDAHITAYVETDKPDLADYIRGAISALLAPPKSKIPEMMFVQDGATAFHAIDECVPCLNEHTFATAMAAWSISADSVHEQFSFEQVADYMQISLLNSSGDQARLELQVELGPGATDINITGEIWKDGKSDGFNTQFFHTLRFQMRTQSGQLYNDGEYFDFYTNTDHNTSFQWIDVVFGAHIDNSANPGQPIDDPEDPVVALILNITKTNSFAEDQVWTMRLRNLQIIFVECGRIF